MGFHEISLLVALIGALVVFTIVAKSLMERAGVPALIGYLILGVIIKLADEQWSFLSAADYEVFEILAKLGVILLLFGVGVESDLGGLVKQLKSASFIWVVSVAVSGLAGFAVSRYLLSLGLVPSVFVGVAMTATSVGVPMSVWRETGHLDSEDGETLIDVAELDDMSGVLFMALVVSVAPTLREGAGWEIAGSAASVLGSSLLKVAVFAAGCYLFSRYLEERLTTFFYRLEKGPDRMLTVVGIAIIIAAVAGLAGFSVAIGAFFAGLIFSRDPKAVKAVSSFDSVSDLFVPFFFVGIGLSMEPAALDGAVLVGAALVVVAVVGKLLGAAFPALVCASGKGALLIGVSMVPRAEITMIIMEQGRRLGGWAVPPEVFGGMVMVAAITSLAAPFALRWMLSRWPPSRKPGGGG